MNSRPLAWRVSMATGVLVASGHEFTQRCWGEKRRRERHDGGRSDLHETDRMPGRIADQLQRSCSQAGHQTDGPMSVFLLFLPRQTRDNGGQSRVFAGLSPVVEPPCASLSVLPCLRGESSSAPLRVQFAAHVLSGTLSISGVSHVQTVGNQQATPCRHTLCTHEFC